MTESTSEDPWQPSWYSFEGVEYRTLRNKRTGEWIIPAEVAKAAGSRFLSEMKERLDVRQEG